MATRREFLWKRSCRTAGSLATRIFSRRSKKGGGLNICGLLSRDNRLIWETTTKKITSEFIGSQLDLLSLSIRKLTVLVLDNAAVHTAGLIKERLAGWQTRGLYIFSLPRSSPHLNIAEILWRKLKY